ncbi:MAG: hypothetical protein A2268_02655 [Candidatus Raymondbacteria bacterium RifOxyA12_full_50_37]|uniref:Flagellin n=1 Tax=Candidatus Raymondbacteria bacterium RIFOXYD12_FULL_49_13 TaxID=1817890 RepID=A0A1F7F5U6_UNCRA|nr:MAG: hypothetical protein A2268_02655 [Candidatus Raymondbacteria bacterium RifOxyA12_full_50_37]OGJ89169.1 MAG: hypothetical protein A2248_11475 [Candidatus Raymondbacteria bacterium RIFOXYA2_FULL_49_16]OGJ96651.1 MAG: hypothetical protein A2453_06590 [Candidatus Raymondbacteria bacterium RIFOXYC2_FULL_50_21]OGK00011.1 MAG: hypothetical protein A2350_21050 [Candidatus Raymondbacteria bacterium RifOxyB12_full_50_8]OGK01963.1 MAG: hypothetical protein A2519_17695 [Candidatus Raymondbacteria b
MNISFSNLTALQAAGNLRATNARLGESILKLSTGLRFNKPSDGAFEFLRASHLQNETRMYEGVKSTLDEYKSIFNLANDAATEILHKLERMQELTTQASDPTMAESERLVLQAEYNTLRNGMDTIVKGTKYDGGGILNAAGTYNQALSIPLAPDSTITMDVNLSKLDVGDADGINVALADWSDPIGVKVTTAANEVSAAITVVGSFISEASAYTSELESHTNIIDSTIQNYTAARSSLIGVDVAEEMVNYTTLDVNRQAATAMLAQANLSQASLLQLYKFQSG